VEKPGGPAKQEAVSALARLVAVPPGWKSSRLPNKVMADIGGQPCLRRVLGAAASPDGRASGGASATDSALLRQELRAWGFPVL